MEKLIKRIKSKFSLQNIYKQKENLYFLTVQAKHLTSFLTHLRDMEDFRHLSLISAVDRIETEEFQLTYILCNFKLNISLAIKVFIDRDNPKIDSIHHLWRQAATYQRELYEMFGITFPGSPRLKENFILEGWQEIPPMRKDFKTKEYSEKTYFPRPGRKTHDPETYMREKLYPEETE